MFKGILGFLLIGSLTLGGCAGMEGMFKAPATLNDVAITTSITIAQEECYRSDKIEKGDMSALEYNLALANQGLRDVALASLGKEKCKVITVYDSQIAEVEAKTGMVSDVAGGLIKVIDHGIIGAGVAAVVGNSGNDYKTSGYGADIVVADKSNNEANSDSQNPATVVTTTTVPPAPVE